MTETTSLLGSFTGEKISKLMFAELLLLCPETHAEGTVEGGRVLSSASGYYFHHEVIIKELLLTKQYFLFYFSAMVNVPLSSAQLPISFVLQSACSMN